MYVYVSMCTVYVQCTQYSTNSKLCKSSSKQKIKFIIVESVLMFCSADVPSDSKRSTPAVVDKIVKRAALNAGKWSSINND